MSEMQKTNNKCNNKDASTMIDGNTKDSQNKPIIGNYRLLRTLEKGKFGVVKLGKHIHTGEKVAIKIIDKKQHKQRTFDEILREVEIMKRLDHPNIIKVLQTFDMKDVYYIVMEYAINGDMYHHLDATGRMNENEARDKFNQILSAVKYCHHQQHIIHRDLKPDNILFDGENNIKIGDFGLSEEFTPGEKLSSFCGTAEYMAPEVFQGHKFDGPKVDVWSLGVMLYEMLTETIPFAGSSWPIIIERVLRGKYYEPEYLSDDCKSLLRKMLLLDPDQRISMDEILKDGWVNSNMSEQQMKQNRRVRTHSHTGG